MLRDISCFQEIVVSAMFKKKIKRQKRGEKKEREIAHLSISSPCQFSHIWGMLPARYTKRPLISKWSKITGIFLSFQTS